MKKSYTFDRFRAECITLVELATESPFASHLQDVSEDDPIYDVSILSEQE